MADTVEKVAAWLFQFSFAKNDLSDRPTNRSRMPVKGKKTPENLAKETASDFFNSIGRLYAFSGDHRKLSVEVDRCTDGSFVASSPSEYNRPRSDLHVLLVEWLERAQVPAILDAAQGRDQCVRFDARN